MGISETSRINGVKTADARRLLAECIAASRYLNRSARLRDLLLYLSDRVLDDEAGEKSTTRRSGIRCSATH